MTADWNINAACRQADPDLFDTCSAAKTVPPDAAAWCTSCPVRQQCYDLAMSVEAGTSEHYRFGIFGGASPAQRAEAWPQWATDHGVSPHALRAGLAPCGTPAAYKRHKQHGEPIDEACAEAYRKRSQAQRDKAKRTRPVGPPVCGTPRGYRHHRKNGEDACKPCKAANAAADRRLATTGSTLGAETFTAKPRGAARQPIAHGTYKGARQHENRGEEKCGPCRDAYNEHRRDKRRASRAAAKAVAA